MTVTTPKRPTVAMVLAAGIGKRMRPLTATTPKPLIEVAGKSLVDHGLDRLAAAGVTKAVVNVHYLADLVEVHVCKRSRPEIVISDEREKLLETGGGIAKALPLLGNEPFFVYNSDSFWIEGVASNFDILADFWDPARMDMLLLLSPTVTAVGYDGTGDFIMDPLGRLERRLERQVSPYVYAGVAIMSPTAFEACPAGKFSLNVLFDRAIESGRLYGVHMDGIWLHVGTPEAIREAEDAIRHSAA
ncbi:nucleotidyltransferase family protein [Prosthecomicrobium sp. N25]|uniref:nucleotidyltransferase family protein n=1 Tax=Prosthecomicrobium sp. N25 TaxID=3129254 RepID=UPI00307723C2